MPTVNLDDLEIVNNTEASRFQVQLPDGQLALIDYKLAGKNIIFTHTEVPVEYEGQGIASKMARHVLDYARDNGLKVQALCPYVHSYVTRHKEYQDITWGF